MAMAVQASPEPSQPYLPIASTHHFILMLLIQLALVGLGFWLQQRGGSGSDSVLPQKRNVVPLYLSVIALEWGLVATVRGAVNDRGIKLRDVIAGRWSNWKDVVRDVATCIPFLLVWEASAA